MQRWICRSILLGLMLAAAIPIARHAVATNDGPAHVAFAHLLATRQQPDHPLQQQAYTVSLQPNPNLAVYLLMDALMRVFSPDATESIIQILCLIGPMAACWFAIGMIEPKNIWLAVFVLPLSLNQMFFLGLYNHCLSTAAFFLAISAYFWMIKAPSAMRALVVAGCLVLTFLCHASGFIMAFAGIACLSAASLMLALRGEKRVAAVLREQRYALGALLAPLPLAAVFLLSGSGGNTAYGVGPLARLKQFSSLQLLAVNLPRDAYVATAISILLLISIVCAIARIVLNRTSISRRDEALAVVVAAAVSVLIMMAFPDSMGGGWTHFRRFEIFPFFWGLLILAFDSFPLPMLVGMMAAGVSAALLFVSSMVMRQGQVREQMAPLAQVDRAIGSHCTVLPIVSEKNLVDAAGNPVAMRYSPYFQSASRLELTGDRVVLFNFLARLDVYPVRFRPNVEPQLQIFHWKPRQEQTVIETIDVGGFEKASGMQVDYILLWGNLDRMPEGLRQQASQALESSGGFGAIYQSSDGRVTLYRRSSGGNSACIDGPA